VNPVHYLIAAYIATWAIHGTYLAVLVGRYRRLRKQMGSHPKPESPRA